MMTWPFLRWAKATDSLYTCMTVDLLTEYFDWECDETATCREREFKKMKTKNYSNDNSSYYHCLCNMYIYIPSRHTKQKNANCTQTKIDCFNVIIHSVRNSTARTLSLNSVHSHNFFLLTCVWELIVLWLRKWNDWSVEHMYIFLRWPGKSKN